MINKNFEQGGAYNAPEAKLLNVKTESVLLNGSAVLESINYLDEDDDYNSGWNSI